MSPAIISICYDFKATRALTVDGELSGSQTTNHDKTGTDASVTAAEAEVLGDLDETGGVALARGTLGLVDLAEHSVGRLGDDGGGETGNQTSGKVNTGLGAIREVLAVHRVEDRLGGTLEHDKLGHGVGDPAGELVSHQGRMRQKEATPHLLLEENRAEARVESTETLVLHDLAEAAHQTTGESGLRDQTNTGSFQRAETNIGDELGAGGRSEVDSGTVVLGGIVAQGVDGLGLEELVATELQRTLEEVTSGSGTKAGKKSASTLILNDLLEATDHTPVVGDRVKLDSCLDADGS